MKKFQEYSSCYKKKKNKQAKRDYQCSKNASFFSEIEINPGVEYLKKTYDFFCIHSGENIPFSILFIPHSESFIFSSDPGPGPIDSDMSQNWNEQVALQRADIYIKGRHMIIPEAGAVTFRKNSKEVEFLIIRSKKDPSKLIFPKGHIERGESEMDAARRELLEEAGVRGGIKGYLDTLEFHYEQKTLRVKYYLYEFLEVEGPGEMGRDPKWYSFREACGILSFRDTVGLVEKAIQIINGQ